MKIMTKNTALGLLTEPVTPDSFTVARSKEKPSLEDARFLGMSIIGSWPKMIPFFKKRIQYISEPFDLAYQKAKHALATAIGNEEITASGTFIAHASPSETNTIFYDINYPIVKPEEEHNVLKADATIMIFVKKTNKAIPCLSILVILKGGKISSWISDTSNKDDRFSEAGLIGEVMGLLLFLKYCPFETKIIEPGRKATHTGQKYVNETKNTIEVLDSTWFTTIIREEGFGVRGHLRLQPYKGYKKLIYIAPYDKEGYVRKAKMAID